MVAKINRGESLYGAIVYNQQKVNEDTARIIFGNRMITDVTDNPDRVMQQTLLSFENYLLANKNTDKPILHISLNPTTDDRLTDSQFAALAKDYMERMGYGDQPYIVYLHEDISRRHIHIVSTCVDEQGNKISDKYEWNRSMKACRELEQKYGLENITDKRKELTDAFLKKADYSQGNLKQQVSNILKSVFNAYCYKSFGEYSALLSCFNIEAKQVRGEHEGIPYDRILQNFQRTAGLFGSLLTTKVFAVVFLALSCLGTQGVKNETITWEKIDAALLAGVVLFFMNWWLLALPLSAVANMAFYTLTLTPEYLLGGTGTLQQPHRQTHQQEGATQIVGNHRRVAHDLLSGTGQPHRHGTIQQGCCVPRLSGFLTT